MAENTPTSPVETGAGMDYSEHERTYNLFLALTKYGVLVTAALLIAMALGFFAGFGFISATITFFLIILIGAWILH